MLTSNLRTTLTASESTLSGIMQSSRHICPALSPFATIVSGGKNRRRYSTRLSRTCICPSLRRISCRISRTFMT